MTNKEKFQAALTEAYTTLFETDPGFAMVKAKMTPAELAVKTTEAASKGNALIGVGLQTAAKALGVRPKTATIKAYLAG